VLDVQIGTVIYEADFSTSMDGWSLNINDGSVAGSLTRENNALTANITTGGSTQGWHIQLAKTGITLTQGETYRWTFTASATPAASVEYYLDNTTDWQAYFNLSPNPAIETTPAEFTGTFEMTKSSATDGRIVFNIGSLPSGTAFTLHSYKLELLSEGNSIPVVASNSYKVYSAENAIVINGAAKEIVTVYSIDGRLISKTIGSDVTTISSAKGLYIVKVGNSAAQKVSVK
jgi:hypothetical protein